MTDRELMQQALDALEYASDQTKPENLHGCNCLICTTILALRDRLAQPEQEPVAWMVYTQDGQSVYVTDNPIDIQEGQRALPLYAAPRPWVGLTNGEVNNLAAGCHLGNSVQGAIYKAEVKLKEKNT